MPFLLPQQSLRLRKTLDQCFGEAKVTPNIFLEASTTELLASLYPYHYGALFCTQMRLPLLLKEYPEANTFPMMLNGKIVQHPFVLAYHNDRFLPAHVHDFIALTEQVLSKIANVRQQISK